MSFDNGKENDEWDEFIDGAVFFLGLLVCIFYIRTIGDFVAFVFTVLTVYYIMNLVLYGIGAENPLRFLLALIGWCTFYLLAWQVIK